MMDFKDEILENDEISIVGEAELIKEVLFAVCAENYSFKLLVGDTYNLFEKYLMVTRLGNELILESVKRNGEFLTHEPSTLIIDEEVVKELVSKKQLDRFFETPDVIFIY